MLEFQGIVCFLDSEGLAHTCGCVTRAHFGDSGKAQTSALGPHVKNVIKNSISISTSPFSTN